MTLGYSEDSSVTEMVAGLNATCRKVLSRAAGCCGCSGTPHSGRACRHVIRNENAGDSRRTEANPKPKSDPTTSMLQNLRKAGGGRLCTSSQAAAGSAWGRRAGSGRMPTLGVADGAQIVVRLQRRHDSAHTGEGIRLVHHSSQHLLRIDGGHHLG